MNEKNGLGFMMAFVLKNSLTCARVRIVTNDLFRYNLRRYSYVIRYYCSIC